MINWKLRLKSKAFWVALIPAALLVAQAVLAAFGVDWSYDVISDKLLAIVNAVFALLTILGIAVDPTTQGISDSSRALQYNSPAGSSDEEENENHINESEAL